MPKARRITQWLAGSTGVLVFASAPLIAGPPQKADPKPKIVDSHPFSLKKATGSGCTAEGDGCVVTVFDDGSVTATDVR